MKKSIDFIITQKCNYRCPYCSQSKGFVENLENASDETISAFLNFLDKISNDFEITITGGEPLIHEKFFYLVEEIIKKGFKISIVSNFSFPIETYKKIKDIAGDNLAELFVSLHTSQIKDLNDFLYKAELFDAYKGKSSFVIGSVLTDENLEVLKYVSSILHKKGIKLELQHLRIQNSFVEYKEDAKEFIEKFPISSIREKNNTYGKICYAGCDFVFIYQNGEAYRCYSSRFNKVHSMGNIKDKNFKLFKRPLPCLNKKCTCPKPIINGMIDFNKTSPFLACFLSFYNAIFIPYYLIKNFNVVKAKIKQKLNFKKKG